MLEQLSNAITFRCFFVESKVGKTGLTVTVDVYRNDTEIVTGGSATEVGDGIYKYTLASGSVNAEGEYVCIFKTATTSVDQQHIAAIWVVNKAGIENLDQTVGSRSSHTAANVRTEIDSNSTQLAAIITALTTIATYIDTEVAAIKQKTDNLPSDPADESSIQTALASIATYIDTEIATILTRIGTPSVSLTDDIAAVQSDTNDIQTRLPAALVSGRMDSSVGAMAANTLTASALATDAGAELIAALFATDIEAGKTFIQAILDIWAKAVGDGAASSASYPFTATYDSPDGSVQVTHNHTTTSRTKV